MFKRVITFPGFWKSALILGVVYAILLFLLQWLLSRFSFEFLQQAFGSGKALVFLIAGLIAGITSTYAKFWKYLKEQDLKDEV